MTEPDIAERTQQALADPKPGDRYQEMFSWWTVVVSVDKDWGITVLEAGGPCNGVRGRVKNDLSRWEWRERHKDEPYPEWLEIEPWQERAEQRHFPSAAEFAEHMRGCLLAGRGLDISGWAQQRAKRAEPVS